MLWEVKRPLWLSTLQAKLPPKLVGFFQILTQANKIASTSKNCNVCMREKEREKGERERASVVGQKSAEQMHEHKQKRVKLVT